MRVFARRERPHPGAQLPLFETADGWRYSLRVTNRPAATRGWLGQNAYLDAAHRVHARIEDVIRTGKDTSLGHFPSHDFAVNAAWLTAAMTRQILLAWLTSTRSRKPPDQPQTVPPTQKGQPGHVEPRPPGPPAGATDMPRR
jgi:hypothetical protein